MFFSVVIPTYNPRPFLPRLLESITHNECLDQIEVIVSDDLSTESFDDIIRQYPQLSIRTIYNEKHMGFPRNGRQHGADVAMGEWICFSDQDDYFLDNAFDKVKTFIEANSVHNYLLTNFIMEISATGVRHQEDAGKGWTHGKFYERSFWKKYNICYDEVDYCEDINLSTKVSCILTAEHLTYTIMEEPIYVWCRREDSLSDIPYFVQSFPDYIKATLNVIMDFLEKYKDDKEVCNTYQVLFLQTFLHMYFYLQSQFFFNKKETVLSIIIVLQPIYERFKKMFNYTNEMLINSFSTDLLGLYNDTRTGDFAQIPFMEQISFKDWLSVYFNS